MEQQIPHKFGVSWEFFMLAIKSLQLRAMGNPKPIISVQG